MFSSIPSNDSPLPLPPKREVHCSHKKKTCLEQNLNTPYIVRRHTKSGVPPIVSKYYLHKTQLTTTIIEQNTCKPEGMVDFTMYLQINSFG